jgi:beta-lactamase class A
MTRTLLPGVAALFLTAATVGAQTNPVATETSPKLTEIAERAVRAVQKDATLSAPLKDQDIAVTVIDLRDPAHPITGDFRGDEKVYPASVVKLFYLAAAHASMQAGTLTDTPELRRGLHDMIVDSVNDATRYVLLAVTDAPNGAELPPAEMEKWAAKRNAVNRYFAGQGYTGVNACQATYADGPYGRERIFLGPKYENRNALTTNATARLLSEIVTGRCVSAERSKQMMDLLHRDIGSKSAGDDDQAHDFSARALTPAYKLWSKAGWTSTARHDAAYIESPDGAVKAVIVTFTTGLAKEKEIVPGVARHILAELAGK